MLSSLQFSLRRIEQSQPGSSTPRDIPGKSRPVYDRAAPHQGFDDRAFPLGADLSRDTRRSYIDARRPVGETEFQTIDPRGPVAGGTDQTIDRDLVVFRRCSQSDSGFRK